MKIRNPISELINGVELKLIPRPFVPPMFWAGNVQVKTGAMRLYNELGFDLVIEGVRLSVGTAPVGSALWIDVNKGGTSIYSANQIQRPALPDGSNTTRNTNPPTDNTWPDQSYLTVDIDIIGTTTPGADMSVQMICRRA